ncbi:hypothetical protein V8G54_013549 [Vigna mungo]|uniref:Uncharacterized protein n=1 Tax=Vigna mungo TaxID=3915 RepID=A0AAQ3NX52_VIGMU
MNAKTLSHKYQFLSLSSLPTYYYIILHNIYTSVYKIVSHIRLQNLSVAAKIERKALGYSQCICLVVDQCIYSEQTRKNIVLYITINALQNDGAQRYTQSPI